MFNNCTFTFILPLGILQLYLGNIIQYICMAVEGHENHVSVTISLSLIIRSNSRFPHHYHMSILTFSFLYLVWNHDSALPHYYGLSQSCLSHYNIFIASAIGFVFYLGILVGEGMYFPLATRRLRLIRLSSPKPSSPSSSLGPSSSS